MRDSFRKNSGFSLVEVIVAFVILGLVISGMVTAFIMSRRNVNFASRRIIALNFSQETLEDLKGKVCILGVTPDRDELNEVISYSSPLPSGDPSGELRDTFGGTRSYNVTNLPLGRGEDNYDFKQVTVTVTWDEPRY